MAEYSEGTWQYEFDDERCLWFVYAQHMLDLGGNPDTICVFMSGDKAEANAKHVVECVESAHDMSLRLRAAETERDELRKQLADLRVDRDTLAGEANALRNVRRVGPPRGPFCGAECLGTCEPCKAERKLNEAIAATDASGALTRAGKDHS